MNFNVLTFAKWKFIRINGALTTSVYSKILLINGAQAKNVYWIIEGAVSINNYSVFCGTIVCNNGALGAINTGVILNGKALLTSGALTTTAITTTMATDCELTDVSTIKNISNAITISPNPISTNTTIKLNNLSAVSNYKLKIYNVLGNEVISIVLTQLDTQLDTHNLKTGIYFYKLMSNDQLIQSGKLISKQL